MQLRFKFKLVFNALILVSSFLIELEAKLIYAEQGESPIAQHPSRPMYGLLETVCIHLVCTGSVMD